MPKKIGDLTLYSVDDLHELLGISKLTLRAYLREGRIRARKLGVSWYVTEDAIREYFDTPQPKVIPIKKESDLRYIVQGVNDLVSESEECETKEEVLEILSEQAIVSLFQVKVIDRKSDEIIEIIKARDFIQNHANS